MNVARNVFKTFYILYVISIFLKCLQQERFRPARQEILNRFGKEAEQRISVKDIAIPDLSVPMELNRFENFSLFIPRHRRVAGRLIEIFMGTSIFFLFLNIKHCAILPRNLEQAIFTKMHTYKYEMFEKYVCQNVLS